MQYLSLFHLIRPHVNFFLRFLLLFVEYANEIGMKRSEIKFQRYIGKRTHKEKRERENIDDYIHTVCKKKNSQLRRKKNIIYSLISLMMISFSNSFP